MHQFPIYNNAIHQAGIMVLFGVVLIYLIDHSESRFDLFKPVRIVKNRGFIGLRNYCQG